MTQFILDPSDPSRAFIGNATEPTFGAVTGEATLTNVHSERLCGGRPCVVHRPSNHHMVGWPITWRDDMGMVERQCPHHIGHPDPDDLAFHLSLGREFMGVHGCDGCCSPSVVEPPG